MKRLKSPTHHSNAPADYADSYIQAAKELGIHITINSYAEDIFGNECPHLIAFSTDGDYHDVMERASKVREQQEEQ